MVTQRIVIEVHPGDGPIIGTFLADGRRKSTPFHGWIELLALLEIARAHPQSEVDVKDDDECTT